MDSSGRSAPRRWMGVGHSEAADPYDAGAEACKDALDGRVASLVVVFASDLYDLPRLLEGINDVSRDVPLIGCSTAGEIASTRGGMSGVVISALGGEGFTVSARKAEGLSERLRGAGAEVAGCIEAVRDSEHKVLMLLTDGLAGDQQEIVRGVYGVSGASVPLVGGCAGDDLKMSATHQFYGREVMRDSVVAAAVGSDAPFGIGVHHGWRPVGEPMVVTMSSNNKVHTLDGRPALDAYLERLTAPEEAWHDRAAFTRFAMTHPLGLRRRSEEAHVRFIADADFEERSLMGIAEIPRGGTVWLMKGDDESVLDATDQACADALASLDRDPVGLIAFDCIARRGVLGDVGVAAEVDRIASHAAGAPVAGFYTYGEIARTRGMSGFHNQTLVVLAVS